MKELERRRRVHPGDFNAARRSDSRLATNEASDNEKLSCHDEKERKNKRDKQEGGVQLGHLDAVNASGLETKLFPAAVVGAPRRRSFNARYYSARAIIGDSRCARAAPVVPVLRS